jgi:hypothetical protein
VDISHLSRLRPYSLLRAIAHVAVSFAGFALLPRLLSVLLPLLPAHASQPYVVLALLIRGSNVPRGLRRFTSGLHRLGCPLTGWITIRFGEANEQAKESEGDKVTKKLLPFVLAALMIPGAALAKGPSPKAGTHPNQGKAKVMYVLKGTVSDGTGLPASFMLNVTHSNRHGKALIGNALGDLTVVVGPNTKLRFNNGATAIAQGDRVMVKIRAQRFSFKDSTLSSDVWNALNNSTAFQIIDWGQPAS